MSQTTPVEIAQFHVRRTPLESLQHFLHRYPTMVPVLVLIVSVIGFGLVAPNFLSPFNLSLILQQVAVVGTLAAAQSLVVLTAGIDLSVGAVMVLASVVMGKLGVEMGVPTPLAILAGILCGLAAGWVNGTLVTRLRLPPFITTLGTLNIFIALVYYLSDRNTIRSQDIDAAAPLLKLFGNKFQAGGFVITWGVLLMLAVFGVLYVALNMTAWGKRVYAIGDDTEAAALAGIQVNRVLLSVYMAAGLICGLAAWSAIGRVGSLIGPYVVGVVLPVFGQGGVFTLGALSFIAAALAVWTLGIETKGLALEQLAAGDEAGGGGRYAAAADKLS